METTRKQSKHSTSIDLKKKGFKPIEGRPGYYINITGIAFNLNTGREMPLNRGKFYRFKTETGREENLTAAKLVLQAFSNIPYRKDKQVLFLDGNKLNLHPENLKYAQQTYSQVLVDKTALLTAIRCYYNVSKDFKPALNNLYTRIYLNMIVLERSFFTIKQDHIHLLKEYLNITFPSIYQIAINNGISMRDCANFINELINNLSKDVVNDLNNDILSLKPYETNKKHGVRHLLKDWEMFLNSFM